MNKQKIHLSFFFTIFFITFSYCFAQHPLIQAMDAYEHPKYLDADEQPLIDAIKKYGPDTPVDTMNARLLHYAASNNYYKTALILLAEGASVNIQDNSGNIPLHDAVFLHHVELVTLLLHHGADPLFANHYDVTPLNLASEDQKICALLYKQKTLKKKLCASL